MTVLEIIDFLTNVMHEDGKEIRLYNKDNKIDFWGFYAYENVSLLEVTNKYAIIHL